MRKRNPADPYKSLDKARRTAYLIAGFIRRELTLQEEEELDAWIIKNPRNQELFAELTAIDNINRFMDWYDTVDTAEQLKATRQKLGLSPSNKKSRRRITTIAITAAACLIAGVIYIFWAPQQKSSPRFTSPVTNNDLLPGRNFAQLKLPDGYIINLIPGLDTQLNQNIFITHGTPQYDGQTSSSEWHELIVPSRSYFHFKLPDGTETWLNASSTIRYPSKFSTTNREIFIQGEAFFKVAHDPAHPFIVRAGDKTIEAIGTAFHVQAYQDEPFFASTLIEGRIKVSKAGDQNVLLPGQQVIATPDKWAINQHADTTAIMAWTYNEFRMRNQPLKSIMRMLSRWYGANIIYEDSVDKHFNGTISRNVPVSEVLHLLEETGDVHFKINNNDIIVTK